MDQRLAESYLLDILFFPRTGVFCPHHGLTAECSPAVGSCGSLQCSTRRWGLQMARVSISYSPVSVRTFPGKPHRKKIKPYHGLIQLSSLFLWDYPGTISVGSTNDHVQDSKTRVTWCRVFTSTKILCWPQLMYGYVYSENSGDNTTGTKMFGIRFKSYFWSYHTLNDEAIIQIFPGTTLLFQKCYALLSQFRGV